MKTAEDKGLGGRNEAETAGLCEVGGCAMIAVNYPKFSKDSDA